MSAAFAILRNDGTIESWGISGGGFPTNDGYTDIISTNNAFAALRSDGSVYSWGSEWG